MITRPTYCLFLQGRIIGFAGEIAISVNRAADQADEFGHDLEQEIEILMLHGALHLLGMDHEKDRGAMARAEKDGASISSFQPV